MSEELIPRRTVQDFCNYYGLTRNGYLVARDKTGVRPRGHTTMLSIADQERLIRYLGRDKRTEQMVQQLRERPAVVPRALPPLPPTTKPAPPDYEEQRRRVSKALENWRSVLVGMAAEHMSVDDNTGLCTHCGHEAPCSIRRILNEIDDMTVPACGGTHMPQHIARWRDQCRDAVVRRVIDHMIPDKKNRCTECGVTAPCTVQMTVRRINKGIAKEIERLATRNNDYLSGKYGIHLPVAEESRRASGW